MTTTTIRLPDELKSRVSRAAEDAGLTTHGFILEAIQLRTAQAEARREFVREARTRLDEMDRTGLAVPWDEVRSYMLDRAAGKSVARPRARKTSRR
jgi:predicted transcriptional regulator